MKIPDMHLLYNAAAHFKAQDRYPDGLIAGISQEGYAGFEATCWALAELGSQGELARRDMHYDRQEMPRMESLLVSLKVTELLEAKTAILDAVSRGLHAEGGEDEEIDEIIAEQQKKTD